MSEIKKYQFDMNNFDEPTIDESELEEEPPPPTFSEEELEQARKESFALGKQEGIKENKESREEYISKVLDKVRIHFEEFKTLEEQRNDIFEKEVVSLCNTIFSRSFNYLQDMNGLQEIIHMIGNVLENHVNVGRITIEVCPEERDDIEERLKIFTAIKNSDYVIKSSPNMTAGSCEMMWENGGAVKYPTKMATEIQKKLEESLAENTDTTQNQIIEENGENHE